MKEMDDLLAAESNLKKAIIDSLTRTEERFLLFLNIADLRKRLESIRSGIGDCKLDSMMEFEHYYSDAIMGTDITFWNGSKTKFEVSIEHDLENEYGDTDCIDFNLSISDIELTDKELESVYEKLKVKYDSIVNKKNDSKKESDIRTLERLANKYNFELTEKK